MSDQYHFITRWRVKASAEDVFDILSQPLEYPRWWPSVYLEATPASNTGSFQLHTRGRLPYTLRWTARTTVSESPNFLTIEATGDLTGRGIWSIVPDGKFTDISFDWKVSALKPIIRRLTFLLRPAFEANHRWAMEQGFASLELELRRYRALNVEESNAIPAPPAVPHFFTRESLAEAALAMLLIAGVARSGV